MVFLFFIHTVGTVPKYHTVGTVPKYHNVGTVPKYHTVGTVKVALSTIKKIKSKTTTHVLVVLSLNCQFL
jgi:hypothetical protein